MRKTPAKKTTPKQIKTWVMKNKHFSTVFKGWDKKLWYKPYDEIVEYITERLRTTLSELEYYHCMIYLWKELPEESLYIPFKRSPQHLKMLKDESKPLQIGTITLTSPITLKRTPFRAKRGMFRAKIQKA